MERFAEPTHDVIIVGAGPVGLSAALKLAQFDIECVILEAEAARPTDLRASTFHPPTLQMLDTLGLTDSLIASGLIAPHWQIRIHETGERAVFDLSHIASDTRYPFRLQCEQSVLCRLAEAKVENEKALSIERGWRVARVEQTEDHVKLESSDGRTIRARWVIGADGAKSTIREALGFDFEGFTYPETTILATTRFAFEEHIEGLSNVNYCWSNHGTFSLLRLPDLWRCSLYSDPDETLEDALRPCAIDRKLQRIVPRDRPHDVIEVRPYRIHQRIVRNYRSGRVVLAGDAAHVNSPSGGMGMNGGIHDAFALSKALAKCLADGSTRELDHYASSRKEIAQEQILKQAHTNRTRMQQTDPDFRRAELARLQEICSDPSRARRHLLKTSMLTGLHEAGAVA